MRSLLVVAVLVSAISSCGKGKISENNAGKDYVIAYNVHLPDSTKDDWEVFTMNTDGSNKKNITDHKDVAWTYNAHANRLFYISDRDTAYRHYFLYETDADGKSIRKVTGLRLEDSWMDDRKNGEELIVTGRVGQDIRYQLFIVNTKTGAYRQITNDTAARFGDPCFSPDGKHIAVSYKKSKRDRSTHEELYLMNDDGSDMRRITQYPEDNPSAKEFGYKAGAARWHPTDNFISYVSRQDGRNSIFAVTPDGKKQWKLTQHTFAEGWHDWSSDGRWLAFNSSGDNEKQFHIMLMNWETKEVKQLTDSTFRIQQAPVFLERLK